MGCRGRRRVGTCLAAPGRLGIAAKDLGTRRDQLRVVCNAQTPVGSTVGEELTGKRQGSPQGDPQEAQEQSAHKRPPPNNTCIGSRRRRLHSLGGSAHLEVELGSCFNRFLSQGFSEREREIGFHYAKHRHCLLVLATPCGLRERYGQLLGHAGGWGEQSAEYSRARRSGGLRSRGGRGRICAPPASGQISRITLSAVPARANNWYSPRALPRLSQQVVLQAPSWEGTAGFSRAPRSSLLLADFSRARSPVRRARAELPARAARSSAHASDGRGQEEAAEARG